MKPIDGEKLFTLLQTHDPRPLCPIEVQNLFEQHYNNIFATGERNHRECDICEVIETTVELMGFRIDYRFDSKKDSAIVLHAEEVFHDRP